MATYVMSDIHGDRTRFHQMLETINLKDSDHLYILGDVIDRGPEGIELLMEIRQMKNAVLILGNHEYMCLQYHAPDADDAAIRRWNRNGNAPTLEGLKKISKEEKESLFTYLSSLPSHLSIQVNGRSFYLVHGFPGENVHDDVWHRPQPDTPNPFPGSTLIIGHTPICNLGREDEESELYMKELAQRGEHLHIFHAEGFIDIDCLCGYSGYPARRLACLRLDDMKEFYV